MAVGALWFFFIGLVFLALAFVKMLKIRTYSFKNKKVLLEERIVFLAAGLGFLILIYVLVISLF